MSAVLVVLLLVCFVLVLPLGVRLLAVARTAPAGAWLAAGGAASVGVLVDQGAPALVLVLPLVVLCGWTAVHGLGRLADGVSPRVAAAVSASSSLGVVGLALMVDRSGAAPLLGFDATVWRLTVLHFCVAGFAASLLVGLTHVARPGRTAAVACWSVPTGTALVAAGHFLGPWLELAGAVSLTAGLLCSSVVVLRHVVRLDEAAGQLLAVAALVTPLTMLLAVSWALGDAVGLPHLTLTQTAATHGVGNALGVGLAGVLGWTVLTREQL